MINFLKDRILLFVLILAGDYVSLAGLIKAEEIKANAITIAIAVSILPSLIISLVIKFLFIPNVSKKNFIIISIIVAVLLWIGFVFSFLNFNTINNQYGKVRYPKNFSMDEPVDSIIVGGCNYTPEANNEVAHFKKMGRTLTSAQLFDDFNYDVSKIWDENERDCARTKIFISFAWMLFFLITGITLLCEILILPDKSTFKTPG
ncbi:MAG: hypothetical protein JWP81_5173 [Ferruginibacter sp.]|nr:hypothetical protein [Ferruginibacter sp.]